jgi:hypothetical protein
MMMDDKICCIKECDLPVLALGLCNKHWQRNNQYGSPAAITRQSFLMRGKTAVERFNLQHKKMEGGCWEWTSTIDSDGYGIFGATLHDVRYKRAHRFSWALHNDKPVPTYMHVCHTCDNPRCVNPAHLWLGTNEDNMKDKMRKGRQRTARGQDSASSKLTEIQVREILNDPRPHSLLAHEYGVTTMTISDIKCRRSWAHLEIDHVVRGKRISPKRGKDAKLTPEKVLAIRASDKPGTELAREYQVTPQLICNIRKRRAWSYI